jgi:hypothetical protein
MREEDARKACPDITLVHVETISEGTEETGTRAKRECLSRHGPMMGNSESEVGPMFACQVGRFCSGHTNNVWYYELMSTHATFGKGTKLRMSMSSRSLLLDSKYSHNVD